jgi:1-deoxy-D-xylulose-5-phosphate reductoisomerase
VAKDLAMDISDSKQRPRTGRILLLGSTGSIGVNTIEVVRHLAERDGPTFEIVALAGGRRATELRAQAEALGVQDIAIADETKAGELEGLGRLHVGEDAALELVRSVARPGDLVIGAMVGAAGIAPTIAALERGCDVALANKETLVAAGSVVIPTARRNGARIIPVDSEHSAIYQCLRGGRCPEEIERLVLTASGGPFRTWDIERIHKATIEQALDHPTWSMGPKVTIDSASMMNKALELIEAHWLFDLPSSRLEAVVHPQSIVHSFVEFVDGSVFAQLSPPDMKMPIQYALTAPARSTGCSPRIDWTSFGDLKFEPVDHDRFPALRTALGVIDAGGSAGAVFNAANEVAVQAFLDGAIPFGQIIETVRCTLEQTSITQIESLEDVFLADSEARERACSLLPHGQAGT